MMPFLEGVLLSEVGWSVSVGLTRCRVRVQNSEGTEKCIVIVLAYVGFADSF